MSPPQRIGRGKAALASVAYLVVSTCLLTLGTWATVNLGPDIVGLLLAMLGTSGSQSQVGLWLLVWPAWSIPMLVAAQLTCMPWVMQTARGAMPTRRSEWFALASCRFVAVLIGLAFGAVGFEQLLLLEISGDIFAATLWLISPALSVAGIHWWAHRRVLRRSEGSRTGVVDQHFVVLVCAGLMALLLAGVCLYVCQQVIGPFQLGIVGLCALLFGLQPVAVRLAARNPQPSAERSNFSSANLLLPLN
jgi:hypothetical protein